MLFSKMSFFPYICSSQKSVLFLSCICDSQKSVFFLHPNYQVRVLSLVLRCHCELDLIFHVAFIDESYAQAQLVLEQCHSTQSDESAKGLVLLAMSTLFSERLIFILWLSTYNLKCPEI